jgi:hypothetical protein
VQKFLPGSMSGITVAGVAGVPGSNSSLLRNPISVVVDNNGYASVRLSKR